MTVDLNNESGLDADGSGLIRLATYALDQLRIHPQAELSILLVDESTMSAYHQKYLGEPGPTDVLSFPMDELRPPSDDDDPPAGLLGDIVLCPSVTARQAAEHGRSATAEAEYLLVHGLLHLLGYDHADPDEKAEMFSLKDKIIAGWATARPDRASARSSGGSGATPGPGGELRPSSGGSGATPGPSGELRPSSGGSGATPGPSGELRPSSGGSGATPGPSGELRPSSGGSGATPGPSGELRPSSGGSGATPGPSGELRPSSGGSGATPGPSGELRL